MAEPIMHNGAWWQQRQDGVWLRWDSVESDWKVPHGPPPEGPMDPLPDPPPNVAVGEYTIEPYRPLKRVATVLLTLFGMALGLDLFAVWSDSVELSLLERVEDGALVTQEEADTSDNRQNWIGLVQITLYIVQIIVFLVWFRRAYRNLPALGARDLRYKPGWAVGSWFVPILNWFRPLQITNDIWKASDPALPVTPPTPWKARTVTALLGFWWAAFWISDRLGQISLTSNLDARTIEDYQSGSRVLLAADATSAIATVFVIAVVWRITKREETRAANLAAAGTLGVA